MSASAVGGGGVGAAAPPVAAAPPAPVYHQCSPDQWDTWYTQVTGLGEGAEPFELLVNLAQELRNEGVPFAEKWGVDTCCGA